MWKAVSEAKDVNCEGIPDRMFKIGNEIENEDLQEAFAEMFVSKIRLLASNANIQPN